MNNKKTFLSFIYKTGLPEITFRPAKVAEEMNEAVNTRLNHPVPLVTPSVRNLLMGVRGQRTMTNVLNWVYEEGLYRATVGRKKLARKAENEFKSLLAKANRPFDQVHIPEDKFFFKSAWPEMARRFGVDPNGFEHIMNGYLKDYEENYEPKTIDLPSKKDSDKTMTISIPELNANLPKGVKPFHFGGPYGLIEQLENGDWAPKLVGKDPYGTNDPVRHGIDLTDPKFVRDPDTGKYHYSYSQWEPPMSNDKYSEIVKALTLRGAKQAHALSKVEDPNFMHEEDPELHHWMNHFKKNGMNTLHAEGTAGSIAELFGFGRRHEAGKGTLHLAPKQIELLKKLVSKGIDSHYQYLLPHKNEVMDNIFPVNPDGTPNGVKTTYSDLNYRNDNKGSSKQGVKHLINKGALAYKITPQEVVNAGLAENVPTAYQTKMDDSQWAHNFSLFDTSHPADLETLTEKDGWRFDGRVPEINDTRARLIKKTNSLSGFNYLDLIRKEDGQWYLNMPHEQEVDVNRLLKDGWNWNIQSGTHGSMYLKNRSGNIIYKHLRRVGGKWYDTNKKPLPNPPGKPAISTLLGTSKSGLDENGKPISVGSVKPPSAIGGTFGFADKDITKQAVDDWAKNPAAYGEPIEMSADTRRKFPEYVGQYPTSLLDGAAMAIKKVIANRETKFSDSSINGMQNDLPGVAFQMMNRIVNNTNFKYGDLDKVVKIGNDAIYNPDGLDQSDILETKAIYKELARVGVTNPQQQEMYVEKMRQIQDNGKVATPEDGFPPEVIEAFLRNGFLWRKNKLASLLRGQVKKLLIDHGADQRNLEDMGGKNKEGDLTSLDPSDDRNTDYGAALASRNKYSKAVDGKFNFGSGGMTRQNIFDFHRGHLNSPVDDAVQLNADPNDTKSVDDIEREQSQKSEVMKSHRIFSGGSGLPGWEDPRTGAPAIADPKTKIKNYGAGEGLYLQGYNRSYAKLTTTSDLSKLVNYFVKNDLTKEQDPNRRAGMVDAIGDSIYKFANYMIQSANPSDEEFIDLEKLIKHYLTPEGPMSLISMGANKGMVEKIRNTAVNNPKLKERLAAMAGSHDPSGQVAAPESPTQPVAIQPLSEPQPQNQTIPAPQPEVEPEPKSVNPNVPRKNRYVAEPPTHPAPIPASERDVDRPNINRRQVRPNSSFPA